MEQDLMKSYTIVDVFLYAISSSFLSCTVMLFLLYRYQFASKTRRVVLGEGGSHSTAVIVPSGYETILQDVYGHDYATKKAYRGSISLVGAGPGTFPFLRWKDMWTPNDLIYIFLVID